MSRTDMRTLRIAIRVFRLALAAQVATGAMPDAIEREALLALTREAAAARIPELWDGKTAVRVVDALFEVAESTANQAPR